MSMHEIHMYKVTLLKVVVFNINHFYTSVFVKHLTNFSCHVLVIYRFIVRQLSVSAIYNIVLMMGLLNEFTF